MAKEDGLDGNIGSRDLVTELSQGLRFIPNAAWQSDDDTSLEKPKKPEPDPLVSKLRLDDDFWAEVEREAAKRRVNKPTKGEPDSPSDSGPVGSPAGVSEPSTAVVTPSGDWAREEVLFGFSEQDCIACDDNSGEWIYQLVLSEAPDAAWKAAFIRAYSGAVGTHVYSDRIILRAKPSVAPSIVGRIEDAVRRANIAVGAGR